MLFNAKIAYQNELMRIFIDALIKDNNSKYNNEEYIKVLEAIINNKISFEIDENDVIYEIDFDGTKTEIFEKDKKNADAIYCIKILLDTSEYEEIDTI